MLPGLAPKAGGVVFSRRALELFAGFAYSSHMLVVHVHVHVKPECVTAFKSATLANGRESLKEPGVARFDVVQQQDDPTRFVLVEVYRDAAAAAAHKETKHYPVWRDAVAPMMAEPRFSVKFNNVFPEDKEW
jgi:(4S)-4-hydroxy-5-phosphonooxypentane-2,3-dione isomerase